MEVQIKVDDIPNLVPLHLYDLPHSPTFFVFGGLVFLPLSRPFLSAYYGTDWYSNAPLHLSNKATLDYRKHPNEQVIVLSHVLSNDINIGYEGYACRMLLSVDGIPMQNMQEFCDYIDSCQKRFIRFDLYQDTVIVLEVSKARESVSATLKTHNISTDRSADLLSSKHKEKETTTPSSSTITEPEISAIDQKLKEINSSSSLTKQHEKEEEKENKENENENQIIGDHK